MKTQTKRLLAVFLALLMILPMTQISAFAAETVYYGTFNGVLESSAVIPFKVTYAWQGDAPNIDPPVEEPRSAGDEVELPIPEAEGWTFQGWSNSLSRSGPISTLIMPTNNVTLTGTWTQDKYDLYVRKIAPGGDHGTFNITATVNGTPKHMQFQPPKTPEGTPRIETQLRSSGLKHGNSYSVNEYDNQNQYSRTIQAYLIGDGQTKDTPVSQLTPIGGSVTGSNATLSGTMQGNTLVVVHNVEKNAALTVTVTKTWPGGIVQDKLPSTVTVFLQGYTSTGTAKGDQWPVAITKQANGSWSGTAVVPLDNGIVKYGIVLNSDGTVLERLTGTTLEFVGRVTSDPAIKDKKKAFTIGNEIKQKKIDFKGTKTWKHGVNPITKRPTELKLTLYAGNTPLLNEPTWENKSSDTWTYKFKNLDQYDASGQEIAYRVDEDLTGLPYKRTDKDSTGRTLVNEYVKELTQVSGKKTWRDGGKDRPKKLNVTLWIGDSVVKSKGNPLEPTWTYGNSEWTYVFKDLDKYDSKGKEIQYTVKEEAPDGYRMTQDGYNFTNTRTTEIKGKKTWWDGGKDRPKDLKLILKAEGIAVDVPQPKWTKNGNEWTYVFKDLDRYDSRGREINYTVEEEDLKEYNGTRKGNDFTNVRTTEIKGKKTWKDDKGEGRPPNLTLILKANGQPVVDGPEPTWTKPARGDEWTYVFKGLDKYDSRGNEIKYTVEEEVPPGYEKTQKGNDFTNTRSVKQDITGNKIWKDGGSESRPKNSTLQITLERRLAGSRGDWVRVRIDPTWIEDQYTFADVDQYDGNGKKYEFRVTERNVPKGYKMTQDGNNFTNLRTGKTDIRGKKTWLDDGGKDRPKNLTVTLMANGNVVTDRGRPLQPDWTKRGSEWEYVFRNVEKYDAEGVEITYTVEETVPEGYAGSQDGNNFTNLRTGTTNRTVTKVWDDDNNRDRKRSTSIGVQLLADETPYRAPLTLRGSMTADTWSGSWSDLPKYNDRGKEIVYTVVETGVPSAYTSTTAYSEATLTFTITNSYTPARVSKSVTKAWSDDDDRDGIRPKSVTVQLYAGISKSGDPVTLSDGNDWSHTWENLPKNVLGIPIVYTVVETSVPGGYTPIYTTDKSGNVTVTNVHIPAMVTKTVRKVWDDNDNQDGIRPASVRVQLKANGSNVRQPVTLSRFTNWTYVWIGLPKNEAGREITYTMEELDPPAGYEPIFDEETFTLTNRHGPEVTSRTVTKAWDDDNNRDRIRPRSVSVQLKANGQTVGSPVTLNQGNTWTHEWTDLPKNSAGKPIEYTVEEVDVPNGYTVGYDYVDGTFTVTNTHAPATVSKSVTKVWNDDDDRDGIRPDEVTVQLYAGISKYGEPVTLSDGNSWSHTWEDLPKNASGVPILYTVVETMVPGGYTPIYTTDKSGKVTVTNVHIPAMVTKTVRKIWDDNNNQDGKRPTSVMVQLLADGNPYGNPVTLSAFTLWRQVWVGLPKYRDHGTEIIYIAEEVEVPDEYEVGYSEDTFTITNTHIPETKPITGTKTWVDNHNEYGTRPGSLVVRLYAGSSLNPLPNVPSWEQDGDVWTYTFSDLPVYSRGVEIAYRVEEVEPEGYDGIKDGNNFTNTLKPGTTSVPVTKTWVDHDNDYYTRPETLTVTLYADGNPEPVRTVTSEWMKNGNGWTYTFEGLPMYDNGVKIEYTVKEVEPDGYTGSQDGYHFTNTLSPDSRDVPVTKIWDDDDNAYGTRPETLTVTLYADGTAVRAVTSGWTKYDSTWIYLFEDLPEFDAQDQHRIVYRVDEKDEDVPAGYEKLVYEYDYYITNRLDNVTEVSGTKNWVDNNNASGTRPTSLTVRLFANGTLLPSLTPAWTIPEAGNQWTYTFAELPKYDEGGLITYTVDEVVPAGYTGSQYGNDFTNTLIPPPTQYTLTVRYWYDAIGGTVAANTVQNVYSAGAAYNVASPTIPGWTPNTARVSGTITGNVEYDVIYTQNTYTLTVNYVYLAGGTAAATFRRIGYNMGDDYSVTSPVIAGHTVSAAVVTGTMPAHNVTRTVIYTPTGTVLGDAIVEFREMGVPLGIGSVVMNVGDCFE